MALVIFVHVPLPIPPQEETDQGDEGEQEEDVDGGEVGGAKKRKPIESKLDLRLQVSVACQLHVSGMLLVWYNNIGISLVYDYMMWE